MGADIVHPVRFTASTSSLPALDHSSAGFADLPRGVGKMIFPRVLVALVEVIGKPLALTRDIFPPGYKSSHLHSLLRPDTDLRWADIDLSFIEVMAGTRAAARAPLDRFS
jgi:hypothetical protein